MGGGERFCGRRVWAALWLASRSLPAAASFGTGHRAGDTLSDRSLSLRRNALLGRLREALPVAHAGGRQKEALGGSLLPSAARPRRSSRLGRRVVIEPILGAVLVPVLWAYLQRQPASAPSSVTETLISDLKKAESAMRDVKQQINRTSKSPGVDQEESRLKLREAFKAIRQLKERIAEAEKDGRAYPCPQYLEETRRLGKLRIAVTGGSGVGKSSWINAIRRIRPSDPLAAQVGITETTMEPEMFAFPQPEAQKAAPKSSKLKKVFQGAWQVLTGGDGNDPLQVGDHVLIRGVSDLEDQPVDITACKGDNFEVKLSDGTIQKVRRDQITGILAECVIWDLPGVGTPNFPQDSYTREMGLRWFDMVVLITANRLTEAEVMLIEELQFFGVPFFLVRNKADADVESGVWELEESLGRKLEAEHRQRIEEQTLQSIKESFKEEFNLERVYCISTRRKRREQFDFLQLENDMHEAIMKQRSGEMQSDGAE